MTKDIKKQNILVGMSGGIDSTMAVLLLKKQGFNVFGATMKIFPDFVEDSLFHRGDNYFKFKPSKDGCYGPKEKQAVLDAKKMAEKIGIPHYVIDLKKEYKKEVLDYFKKEYLEGKTPNPCVVCNSRIKFGYLLKFAQASGINFDKFATGHYARVSFDKKKNRYVLKKGKDETKDQSYFLYRLTQNQLKNIIFPLGEYRKSEIKKMAKKIGYKEIAEKKESQNFIECDNYGTLFKNKFKKGNILDVERKILGKHNGVVFYTVGQRKGLDIGGLKEPFYVIRINAKKNEIVVGPKGLLFARKMTVKDSVWNFDSKVGQKIRCQVKIRFGAPSAGCRVTIKNGNTAEVKFAKEQFAIAPGQSAVFYKKDEVLGGGIIAK